jgi:SNF2 family DNA or RNA helicase
MRLVDYIPKTRAWPHQLAAIHKYNEKGNLLFHHGMGCGKTKQIIDIIGQNNYKLTLIVCPKSVIPVWPEEFAKHGDGRTSVLCLDQKNTKLKATAAAAEIERANIVQSPIVLVINYDSVWLEPLGSLLMKVQWDLIVCDESHRIKSISGKASRYMGRIGKKAKHRACLTGTPMPHSPLDIYAQYRFLDPTVFGTSYIFFRNQYAIMGGFRPAGAQQGVQVLKFINLDQLSTKMYSIGHHVTKQEVLKDLPPVTHQYHRVILGEAERRAYDQMETNFIAEVNGGVVTAQNALAKLTRLQQIASGFGVDEATEDTKPIGSSKKNDLTDLLEGIDKEESVVIFCRFRYDIDQCHKSCYKNKRASYELSGSKNELNIWKQAKGAALVVQIQAGSEGIDLTLANYAIYYSLTFSLGTYEQSLARLDRPGQKNAVTYMHLIASNTVEDKIYAALRTKKNVVDRVVASYRADAAVSPVGGIAHG